MLSGYSWDKPQENTRLFHEEPVPLAVFVRDKKYLSNPPLSEVQFEAVRHAERIYYPHTYQFLAQSSDRVIREYWKQPVRMVNFLDLEWGKGSGKDHIARTAALRVCYLLLCLTSPQDYYEMPEQDSIHCLNVASNSKQATRAFFTPMRRAVSRPGNWFQTMGVDIVESTAAARAAARRQQRRPDGAKVLLDTIRFTKNIEAVSGHSDAESQEGLNLILGIADEIDAFKSQHELEKTRGASARESASSAEAILALLQTSASTRFPEVYKNIRISYPRYLGSTIQKLIHEGREDNRAEGNNSRHYVSGPLCTWEVNPRISGKEVFANDYRKDPRLARAKYECKPTHAVNPFFNNEEAVRQCQRDGTAPVKVSYVRDGRVWKPLYQFSKDFYPITGARYAMHADLATSGDRAGVALSHVQRWQGISTTGHDEREREITISEARPVVKVDFIIAYESDVSEVPPREIQIRWVGELLLELRRRGFRVDRFTCDGYQSVDLMQRMETHGIETQKVSTDRTPELWETLRDLMYERRLDMQKSELTIVELLGLSKLPGGKVDHIAEGSKDLADALAGSAVGALVLGGEEDPGGARAYPGGSGVAGGTADKTLIPIGMMGMDYLVSDDPLPVEREDDMSEFASFFRYM